MASFRERIVSGLRSIRFRLTLWFVIILAVILTGFSTFVYTRQVHEYTRETAARLQAQSRQIESYYRFILRQAFEREHGDMLPSGSITSEVPLLSEDQTLLIIDPRGSVIQQLGPLPRADVIPLQKVALQAIEGAGAQLMMGPVDFTYVLANPPVTVAPEYQFVVSQMPLRDTFAALLIVGSPLNSTRLYQLAITLIFGSLGLLLLALGGGYWLADRAMRPVQIITHAARAISDTDLNRRIKLGGHDELSAMANTFDQMLDRLQAAFERQRQFTADASHELRTPLTIIELEASRALSHTRSIEEYESALMTIRSENELMSRMVNDLLTLARMDAGQTTLRSDLIDLSDVAIDVVERLSPLAKQKHVELVAGDLPEVMVRGDRQLLNQMLTNLVENAIKYSATVAHVYAHEHARVNVETGAGDAGAWVRVQDNGPGIPTALIPKLFDRFYRVDEARGHSDDNGLDEPDKPRPSGSGLGLSIVQWIVHAHSGKVEVTSEPGQGASFEVQLPSHVDHDAR